MPPTTTVLLAVIAAVGFVASSWKPVPVHSYVLVTTVTAFRSGVTNHHGGLCSDNTRQHQLPGRPLGEGHSATQVFLASNCKSNGIKSSLPRKQRIRLSLSSSSSSSSSSNKGTQNDSEEEIFDVIVVGAGIGGLSCAALSAKYGMKTLCLEAHDTAGGCAHSFKRYNPAASKDIPFCFDSGPSLISGLSKPGTNPLRQVLDAINVADQMQWKTYTGWIVHDLADGKALRVTTGNVALFAKALEEKTQDVTARVEFEKFAHQLLVPRGLSEASAYIPPFALRGGLRAVASLAQYAFKLLSIGTKGTLLTGPFSAVMDQYELKHPAVRYWFDYLAFALSGLDAAHTQAAPVAYMMMDLHKDGAVLDYPVGGMDSLVQALVTGLKQNGGELRLNSRVGQFLLDESSSGSAVCQGVIIATAADNDKSGKGKKVIRARKGVVCNAPLWNMARILQDSVGGSKSFSSSTSSSSSSSSSATAVNTAVRKIQQQADQMYMTGSFMHLHLGIPKDGLPDDLECHHSVLDFSLPVTAEQNMVIISIPTVFDPNLAPPGYHVVHAYTAACDDFEPWKPFLNDEGGGIETGKVGRSPNSIAAASYKKSPGYDKLKKDKAEVLWKAVERVIPDVRERAKRKDSIVLIGTPLTHRRYNQRYRGTYGPAPSPGKSVWELPGSLTPIQGLLACGDTTFPGIGLPGVAASGTIAANTLATIRQQTQLMRELKEKGALQ